MSDIVIQVENLSKKYIIGYQKPKEYTTLRDSMANRAKSLRRKLLAPSGKDVSNTAGGEYWALKDVSFEVKQGEVLGIIGRNGAGKSTLLKILSRITEPTTGSISIQGRVASLLEVGTGFHPELTGRENIYLNGAILGMSKVEIKKKFDEIVAFAEVEKFLDTPVKRYSSGMYVRLAFAVAAHLEPEILIVDEVLAVGDAAFQKKCLGKMGDVAAREGRTVLFVSHNLGPVQALCHSGLLLQNGTVSMKDNVTKAVGKYLRTLEQTASENLSLRTDRRGKGEVRLTQVDISTVGEYPSSTLITGSPTCFIFQVSAILPGTSITFTIYDQYGQVVVSCNSAVHSAEDLSEPKIGPKFLCEMDELLLTPGRYRINVAITTNGELQDHVEGAAVFDVEQGHLRGRLVTSESIYSSACFPQRWTLPA